MEYRPSEIEPKWRAWWINQCTYAVHIDHTKPKYYILDMFPYPSGAGLHVGHPLGYIASDILSRYKRLQGFNVLHPMGFDAFGLPAEQYAIDNGIHPAISTRDNIASFKRQLGNLGLCYDWNREVQTCDPKFYKWTQWIFLQMFNHWYDTHADQARPISELIAHFEKNGNQGVQAATSFDGIFTADVWKNMSPKAQQDVLMNYRLMYRKVGYVNWCEALGTVLANDEVINGVSERGGHPVEIKPMLQWSMRITAYAERLLSGLDTVDYPDGLRMLQRNWIGRSEGAQVFFDIENSEEKLEIYTTRPDTIFGATFMVLAPEHDLVDQITTEAQRAEIKTYLDWVKSRTERERQMEKVVSGAFTGAYALHPFSGARIPIYIAEYVLKGYGTGAIMGVPADDERDFRFAEKYKLPVVQIVDKTMYPGAEMEDKVGKMVNSDFLNGMEVVDAIKEISGRLESKGIGKKRVQYKLRDANYSRQRYWGEPFPIVYDAEGVAYALPESELPLELPHTTEFKPGGGKGPLAQLDHWVKLPDGLERDTDTMPGFAGSSWYFLRYMDPHNEEAFASPEAINYWQDVDFYIGGAEHAVGHLLYSRMWHKFLFDKGLVKTEEPYKKLVNQGMIGGRSNHVYRANERFFEEYLMLKVLKPFFESYGPIKIAHTDFEEDYTYDFAFGSNDLVIEVTSAKQIDKIERVKKTAFTDHKRLLILTTEELSDLINEPKVIADKIQSAMQSKEPLITLNDKTSSEQLYVSHSLIHKYSPESFTKHHVDVNIVDSDVLDLEKARKKIQFKNANFKLDAANGDVFTCSFELEKMSKRYANVVNPDDMVEQHGADCFRMYEMFLGPIEVSKPWDTKGITGVSGFLKKFWQLFFNGSEFHVSNEQPTRDENRVLHTCIKKVTDDIERFSMNTCVSHFMIVTNDLRRLNCNKRSVLEPLVIMLAPFGPHIAEELWHRLGHESTVFNAAWPALDEAHLKSDTKEFPVQINGKLRATIELPTEISAADAEAAVLALEQIQRWLEGQKPKKVVFIPGRMINLVV
ncbi:MAG: leucine--tRNA ligase [Saprospiraceae bacterium]|nr:leucine--tRNA ligase [Saprospiraceae bacterium]